MKLGIQQVRYIRFDDFDIYSVEFKDGSKMLFHAEISNKRKEYSPFKFLGSNGDIWLCKNVLDDSYCVSHFRNFVQYT